MPVLDLTGESVACKEDTGCHDLSDSRPQHMKGDVNKEDNA